MKAPKYATGHAIQLFDKVSVQGYTGGNSGLRRIVGRVVGIRWVKPYREVRISLTGRNLVGNEVYEPADLTFIERGK